MKKTGLFESVSMYFTELLCLHFLVFTCCSHVKSTRLCGKGQGLLQIIIERNKKKKCREMSGDLDEHVSAGTGKETKPQN